MFEKNDPTIDLERYKRIIFEWCSGVNGILHVDLDRSEGWLYVKCKDKESAGQGKSAKVIRVSKRQFDIFLRRVSLYIFMRANESFKPFLV